jgi:hypothetical protein
MNGLQLTGMESSDMLDVVHYLFEEDMRYSTGEEAEAVSKTRETFYRDLYGYDYKYVYNSPKQNSNRKASSAGGFDFDDITPYDPNIKQKPKPFIPATQFDADSGLPLSGNGLLEPPLR